MGADGPDLFRDQDLVDLLEFDGDETVEGVLKLDAAIIAAPLSHCRRLRRETLAAPDSPCR
jgi:hypothetical protein